MRAQVCRTKPPAQSTGADQRWASPGLARRTIRAGVSGSERVVCRQCLDERGEQLARLLSGQHVGWVERNDVADRLVVFPDVVADQQTDDSRARPKGARYFSRRK
jgi:hypothetical protein